GCAFTYTRAGSPSSGREKRWFASGSRRRGWSATSCLRTSPTSGSIPRAALSPSGPGATSAGGSISTGSSSRSQIPPRRFDITISESERLTPAEALRQDLLHDLGRAAADGDEARVAPGAGDAELLGIAKAAVRLHAAVGDLVQELTGEQ